jgi:capsular polysaccharide biosynthesis protein
MEEINIKDLLMYFVKKIPVIAMVSFVMLAVGMLYSVLIKQPLYHGDVTLILVQENKNYNQNSNLTQSDIALNQKLVTTYSEIIKSKRVLNRVIDEMKLDYKTEELAKKINVASVKDTEIIKIAVSDADNKKAAKIANKIASVFQNEVTDIYNLENVAVIDSAEVQTEAYNINIVRDSIIFFAVGFVLTVGIYFVIYYFDTSIKSVEEVEKELGVPVIGTIPLSRKGKK